MKSDFTRKFILTKIPKFEISKSVVYVRYYLYSFNGVVIRVQSIDDRYEIERKKDINSIEKESQKITISEDEFTELTKGISKKIIRKSIIFKEFPNIKIRIYENNYLGLIRAEISFPSETDSTNFKPYSWFGKEITNTLLGKDENLLKLSQEEFHNLVNKFTK